MKKVAQIIITIWAIFSLTGCERENFSQNVAELKVEFTWEGMKPCDWGNPEIHIGGIPNNTQTLKISMYDHAYNHDHGTVQTPYIGNEIIGMGTFKQIQGPCPVYTPGRYEITIKALNSDGEIIGMGSKERHFPEE